MEIVWASAAREVSVRDVAAALPEYAYTTLATVLDRLVHKGLLNRRMDGRTIRFAPIGSAGAHTAVLMHKVLDDDRDPEAALLLFAENLTETEASVLRRALNGTDSTSHLQGA